MATITVDSRRTDLRTNVYATPYWITSGDIGYTTGNVVLFSFPDADQVIWIHQLVMQVTTVYDALTVTIGSGTIATDAAVVGDTITVVDVDEFLLAADVTGTSLGYYGGLTAHKSDWLTSIITMTYAAPNILVGAATATPIVYAAVSGATSGASRLHMLISRIPGK
jgi:hypothetical protein